MRDHDVDDDRVVPDAGSVRVPLKLMDGRWVAATNDDYRPRYQPRFAVAVSDEIAALRQRTRDRYVKRLENAWRSNKPGLRDAAPAASDAATDRASLEERRRAAAYDAMVRRTCNAWRKPWRDAVPAPHDDPAAALRSHLGEEDEDAAAAREQSYANYLTRLSSAWRTNKAANRMVTGFGPGVVGAGPTGPIGPGPTRSGR
jgi:hypothetical protein